MRHSIDPPVESQRAKPLAQNAARLERTRLDALLALDVLDTPPEVEFDALINTAALICEVPISLKGQSTLSAETGAKAISMSPHPLPEAWCV